MNKYVDIINLTRPISNHPKMPMENRAKEFMPFAALTGYNESIIEEARPVEDKRLLSKDEIEKINNILSSIDKDKEYQITYFVKDNKKEGGKYQIEVITIKKIDLYHKYLITSNNKKINIEDIYDIII